jgi:hypothetical protein
MTVVPIEPDPGTGVRFEVVTRASVSGGPVDPAVMRRGADGGIEYDAVLSPEARTEMGTIADRRLQEIQARDHEMAEVERLRGALGLSPEDTSSDNIAETIERLRTERAHDPAALEMVEDLARARGAESVARRELTQASELMGNTAAVEVMEARGATPLWGNPTPPGRSGEFDFIYVIRNEHNEITQVFVVEAKGATSSLGAADFDGMREQGSRAYMRGIAEGMRPRDDSELDRVLRSIAAPSGDGPEVRYLLVQAKIDAGGNPLPPRVREFDVR